MNLTTHCTQTFRRRLGAGAVLALLVAGGALAGCGGDADAQDTGAGVPKNIEEAYNECLKDAGYPEVAEGKVGAPGKDPIWDDEDFQAAQNKCEESSGLNSYKPEGHGEDVNRKAQDEEVLAMTECLRDRGWKLDDPQRTDEGLRLRMPQLDDAERQREFQKDFQECGTEAGVSVDGEGKGDGPGDGGHEPDGHDSGGHDHESHDHGES